MKRIISIAAALVILSMAQGCATSSAAKTSAKSSSRSKKVVDSLLIPEPVDNYELVNDNAASDSYIQRRGKRARGTNDY